MSKITSVTFNEAFNKGHLHETQDRINLVQHVIEDFLTNSSTADNIPKLKELFEQAATILGEAYQLTGAYDTIS